MTITIIVGCRVGINLHEMKSYQFSACRLRAKQVQQKAKATESEGLPQASTLESQIHLPLRIQDSERTEYVAPV